MASNEIDDETLMAYADGALTAEEAERVERAAAEDPAIADRIESFRQTGALLGALGASRPLEPLSDNLARRIETTLSAARRSDPPAENVVPLMARAAPRTRPSLALAASVALLAGVVGGLVVGLSLRPDPVAGQGLAVLDTPAIGGALDRLASGERDATGMGEVSIIASFLTDGGTFCREFEYDATDGETLVSVACREDGDWRLRFAVVAAASTGTSYAPASSLETLDAYLGAIGAGAPLSPEDEAARLAGQE